MRAFIALFLGLIIGAAVVWFIFTNQGSPRVKQAQEKVEGAAKSAGGAVQDELHKLNLSPDTIKDELARTGQVVRRKAQEAGKAIADATADARITAAIKAKLLASPELSALNISVNTTGGVVTLSGHVASADDVGKAVLLAMQTDGVSEVISTIQVQAKR